MKKNLLCFLFFLGIFYPAVFAQHWKNITNTETVNCISSYKEFLYVGTTGGLLKINTNNDSITVYNRGNSGLISNNVTAISIDKAGILWMTAGSNFLKFDGTTWVTVKKYQTGLNLDCVLTDPYGKTWVTGYYSCSKCQPPGAPLISYRDTSMQHLYRTNSINRNLYISRIQGICFLDSNKIWLQSLDDILQYDGTHWDALYMSKYTFPYTSKGSLVRDKKGKFWVGGYRSLMQFNETGTIEFTKSNSGMPCNNANYVAVDDENKKWIATDSGLAVFDDVKWKVYYTSNSALPSNSIKTIHIDSKSNKWIATEKGLVKFDGTTWKKYNINPLELPDNTILSMAMDTKGNKWMATYKGLVKLNEKFTLYEPDLLKGTNSYPTNLFKSKIVTDLNDNIWFGSGTHGFSIIRFDGTQATLFDSSSNHIFSNSLWYSCIISSDSKNNIWVYSENKLLKYDGKTWLNYSGPVVDNNLYIGSIFGDKNGMVWFSGFNNSVHQYEFIKYDGTNYTIKSDQVTSGRASGTNSIATDKNDNLWVGFGYNGSHIGNDGFLKKFGNGKWLDSIKIGSNVISLTTDFSNNIWIGTVTGLLVYNGHQYLNFDKGIYGNNYPTGSINSLLTDQEGNIWAGTDEGLWMYPQGNLTVSGIEEEEKIYSDLEIFPNPSKGNFYVRYASEKDLDIQLSLFNSNGNEIYKTTNSCKAGTNLINLQKDNLAEGVYFLKLNTPEKMITKKCLIIR